MTSKLQIYFYGMILGALMMIIPQYNYSFFFGIVHNIYELLRLLGLVFFITCGVPIAIAVVRTLFIK
ncbi:hypothetical protein CIB95_01775 [Lottiidibacillus patelloidae]|uniref:Uncharacterized protein n=1 Tax=Lottiidibacillus patelloidae TaxID=2670334 RepID=A0A263BX90_9BACI|nr:hypothetical protein [Lottiidibacillus patelloidae]OZM58324.1 hypothetical protein CIB95_01775 [Lottiidibacillus patelloidae]